MGLLKCLLPRHITRKLWGSLAGQEGETDEETGHSSVVLEVPQHIEGYLTNQGKWTNCGNLYFYVLLILVIAVFKSIPKYMSFYF